METQQRYQGNRRRSLVGVDVRVVVQVGQNDVIGALCSVFGPLMQSSCAVVNMGLSL